MGREVIVAVTDGKLDFGPWEQIGSLTTHHTPLSTYYISKGHTIRPDMTGEEHWQCGAFVFGKKIEPKALGDGEVYWEAKSAAGLAAAWVNCLAKNSAGKWPTNTSPVFSGNSGELCSLGCLCFS